MSIFDILEMIGGLCLFLFGMSVMGQALEKRAGGKLRSLLAKMTGTKMAGFLTGLGVTAIIQSSSATTVMVVGFVNSGLMTLRQAINVIMGANVGTTVTAWILSLSGISSDAVWIRLLKPSSFTPVLALVGIILYMFTRNAGKKDTGMILLGFATLMFGMETMSGAVSVLKDSEAFTNLFLLFSNPVLGMLAGAVLTAIIQSSSASVGILQALASTGSVTYGAAIPIIMGQNIGTCVTALISSIGANRNAKRAAVVHLLFNIIGTVVWLTVFTMVRGLWAPAILMSPASMFGIAVAHSIFNVLCTALLLPLSDKLETLALRIVPDGSRSENRETLLDDRLLMTPPLALGRCHELVGVMADKACKALTLSLSQLDQYNEREAKRIRELEKETDRYEDEIGTYLIKISSRPMSQEDSENATALLKYIGDFERIADLAVDILVSTEEMLEKKLQFSQQANGEMQVLRQAIQEIIGLAVDAFRKNDLDKAVSVEPLEQVVDSLKERMRTSHILRMKKEACSIEVGFVWLDLLTSLERVADHCSNIAGSVVELSQNDLNLHQSLRQAQKENMSFRESYQAYFSKYALPAANGAEQYAVAQSGGIK